MSGYENKEAFNSPMEVVFSWPTPSTGESSNATKRKSQDDSGYGGSPVSSKRPTIRNISGNESDSGFLTPSASVSSVVFTPDDAGLPSRCLNVLYNHLQSSSKAQYGDPAGCYPDLDESLYHEPVGTTSSSPTSAGLRSPDVLYSPPEILFEGETTKDLEGAIASCSLSPTDLPARKRAFSTACPATPKKNKSLLKRIASSAPPTVVYHQLKSRRYLGDFEKLDIIGQLGVKMDVPHILEKILSHLSDTDLSNMTMVSKTWKKVCLASSKANKRWLSYTNERKQNRENLHASGSSSGRKSKKTSLGNHDINHSTPLATRQPKSPPVSPTKTRFNSILKVSSNMTENEVLVMCPSCQRPYAVPKSSGVAMCSSPFCGYKFCMICKAAYHPNRPCPLLTPSTPTTPTKLYHNKRNSRRNLRRL